MTGSFEISKLRPVIVSGLDSINNNNNRAYPFLIAEIATESI